VEVVRVVRTISQEEIARRLGVGKNTVKRATAKAGVTPLAVGRRQLYTRQDLVKWLGEERVRELFDDYFAG